MDFKALRNSSGTLTVAPGGSDRVHFLRRQWCSGPSRWVQHHPGTLLGGCQFLAGQAPFGLFPRGTQPFQPLPGVRAESTGVHQIENGSNIEET